MLLKQHGDTHRDPRGLARVEEKELYFARNVDTGKNEAAFTARLIDDHDGRILREERWVFVDGNPESVSYDTGP